MKAKDKNINRFVDSMQSKFDTDPKKEACKETLLFLVKKGFLKNEDINRFIACKEYPKFLESCDNKKTNAVLQLSYYLDTEYYTIWNIISHNSHLINNL